MVKQIIQITEITPQEISELIQSGVKKELDSLSKSILSKNANDEILSREQTAKLLQINLSTLHFWTKANKLKSYGISGSRRYYKRSEVMEALTQVKK